VTSISRTPRPADIAQVDAEQAAAPGNRMTWPAAILAILGLSMLLWGSLLMGIGALIG